MDTHTLTRGQAWAEYVRATPALSALNAACRFAFLVAYISANPEIFAEINPVAGIVLSRREDSICFHKVLPTCQTVPTPTHLFLESIATFACKVCRIPKSVVNLYSHGYAWLFRELYPKRNVGSR